MKRILRPVIGLLALLSVGWGFAFANPVPYINSPLDTVQATVNAAIASMNAVTPGYNYTSTCSGTTTATCLGIRFVASVTGLTTAAGVTSATMTVTDTNIVAASQVNCFVSNYGGAGNPLAVDVLAAANSVSFAVQNTHASAALNATVPVACFVYN